MWGTKERNSGEAIKQRERIKKRQNFCMSVCVCAPIEELKRNSIGAAALKRATEIDFKEF